MAAEQHRRRRWPKWILLGVVVVVAGLIILSVGLGSEDSPTPDASPTGAVSGPDGGSTGSDGGGSDGGGRTPDPSDASVGDEPTEPPRDIAIDPGQPRPTESPDSAPAPTDGAGVELEPVAPEVVVDTSRGAVISLKRIEAVQGQAAVGGEISGPAIRVTVAVRNEGDRPMDLEYVVVNAYSGKDRTPTAPIMQPGGDPFTGSLDAGASAEGVYLFSLEESARQDVTITVDHRAGEPVVVFEGDLT